MSLLLCGPHVVVQPGAAPAVRSAGASPQGVILVYDIANRWSFDGINRWIKEIDEVCLELQRSLPVGARVSGWGRACGPGHQASAPGGGVTSQHRTRPDARTRNPKRPGPACGQVPRGALLWSRGVTGSDRAAACWRPDQPHCPWGHGVAETTPTALVSCCCSNT